MYSNGKMILINEVFPVFYYTNYNINDIIFYYI